MSIVPPSAASMRGAVDLSSLLNRPPAPAAGGAGSTGAAGQAGQAGAVSVPSLVFQGTDANFGEILDLSANVPVIVDLWSARSEQSAELTLVLTRLILEYGGRFVLATVDVDTNPQLTQAFQAQSIPTVAAVIGGQPVALFNGVIAEDQVRAVLQRVLELAAEHGVVGTAVAPEGADAATPVAPPEPELPPHHVEAYEAIERGDYAAAIAIYKTALARDPRDNLSVAGLAQVGLLARLQGKTLAEIRAAAAAAPDDLEAQLLVADLDLSGGHVEDAFDRLLTLFPAQDAAGKNRIRERILDLFEVIGQDDPRVAPTRKRLTMLLY
ncbi:MULTISPECIES: tetratricopeptide repeat protein [unclassified Cryobacterium]|uniref:tetratricopeptide repeat protein n=1 Tax=unclassified Cryobacterium TaxID=2649013 RepID=UPI0010696FEF|nr:MULTISPECIES: tetratricopeptide repeat protein [unclassified Cryobacterium]MDY7528098.1 tetratricopeptide repeat protein [Cryobacterium sp. 10C2]MDY7556153.1 tetratricopeptide repeat protein [Cryobacterium sp. 10C3]MEB0002097.1 tetratricopeptide repeat protein [Cryobacterium sp. RTC2.1]MEB0200481.1 tetratricopeptide repeat protein [Cryobacterium sp. 5I3]MEB0290052.1 tetratricopeptide repeat protein [Cryobacterium sp. 10C2]